MVSKTKYIIQHISGRFINLHYEYVPSFDKAARFNSIEEAEYYFKESYYKSNNPDQYIVVPMRITYELETEEITNVQQVGDDRKDSGSASGF